MHLRVMESLGGDTRWSDRFFARHAAIVYFWVLVVVRPWGKHWYRYRLYLYCAVSYLFIYSHEAWSRVLLPIGEGTGRA